MSVSTQITLRNIASSPTLESEILEKAAKLEHFCSGITRCRATVALEGRHKHRGRQFSVTIEVHVPGGDFAVNHQHDEDVHIAIRDAFDAARRKLEEHARVRRGAVKRHDEASAL